MAFTLAFGSVAPVALAQQPDFVTKSTARKLGAEGFKLFEQGDYKGALEKFNLANRLVPAPTLGLGAARCLVKLGRLVEASEKYLEVTQIELERGASVMLRKAQAEAVKEREELLPTIPNLEIVLEGPQGKGVKVFVDGSELPAALIGQKRPIDPGPHEIEARREEDSTTVQKKIELHPSKTERVVLELPELPPPAVKKPDPTLKVLGWIAVGIGAGGLIAGAVNGGIAIGQERELLAACPDRKCAREQWSDVDRYEILRGASTAGFVMGAVGLAAGVPLLLLAPSEGKDKTAARVVPFMTPTGAGLSGAF